MSKPLNKLIYIAGKITGLEPQVAKEIFEHHARVISIRGYDSFNPFSYIHDSGYQSKPYNCIMKIVLRELLQCDAVFMISNWQDSRGAIIERDLAIKLEMPIFYYLEDVKL